MRPKFILVILTAVSIYGIVLNFTFFYSLLGKNSFSLRSSHFLNDAEKNFTSSKPFNQSIENKFEKKTLDYNKYSEYYCLRKKAEFNKKDYSEYWKYKTYSKCKTATNDLIIANKDEFKVECKTNPNPKYYYDPGEPEFLYKKGFPSLKWINEKRDIGASQFVLIKCSEKSIYTRVFFNYNKKAVDKAENIRKRISSTSKPFTVALLVFDSVSMLSAQNNLPKSWNFLNNNQNVFKFDFAKSFSSTTRTNMIPVFYGMNLTYQETLVGGSNMKDQKIYPKQKELQEKHAIWKHFSNLGYVTYFGYDSGFDFLAKSLGTEILTDHKFINFYKITNSAYKFNDMTANQRCAGDQGGHKPMLDHTLKYYSTYKGVLKFGYTHISSAHEDTGNIRTVDEDLYEFLNNFFKLFSENKEDYVLFVMGDHGRMNNLLRFDNRGYLDVLNPMMFIAASQSVKDLFILKKNTERLIGRFDLHLTLKDLASFPYGGLTTEDYYGMKNLYSVKDVVSLFREEIKINRTCEDIGSNNQKCACDMFKPIDLENSLYNEITYAIIKALNKYLDENAKELWNCGEPVLYNIKKAEFYEIRDLKEGLESIYKISYYVQNNNYIDAEVYFWLSKEDIFLKKFVEISKKVHKTFSLSLRDGHILIWNLAVSGSCKA